MEPIKSDIIITCACGTEFIFTVKEQEFYEQNNYLPPKRCRACRNVKRLQREQYNRGGSSSKQFKDY